MNKPVELSTQQARRLVLAAQQLVGRNPFGRGRHAAAQAVAHLGYVQIDTISVIERAHHHVLYSRIDNYRPQDIDPLQRQHRQIFEYWYHAAALLPMRDYRFSLPVMRRRRKRLAVAPRLKREILARIKAEGPLGSRAFDAGEHRSGGWWDWKPAKRCLEAMFLGGTLMVDGRDGFQKRFDLPERILPPDLDVREPEPHEWAEHLILGALRAQGLARLDEILHLRSTRPFDYPPQWRDAVIAQIQALQHGGIIRPVRVAGTDAGWALPQALEQLPARITRRLRLLSPFDNLVIQRRRLQRLFDFDYLLECYVPANNRQHGYFALPMLYGSEFVGRIDLKADRRHSRLEVRQLTLETPREDVLAELPATLDAFARWHGCEEVTWRDKPPFTGP